MLLRPAVDQVEEGLLDLRGDRAATSGADDAPIERLYRRDLGGRAREERLVGDVDVVASESSRDDLVSQFTRERDHRVARDPHQGGGDFGLKNLAILDDEDVLARALCNESVDVQQQGLVIAVFHRFLVGQNGVGVGGGELGARHGDVDVMACERCGLHAYALLDGFLAQVGTPRPGGDRHMYRGTLGRDAHLLRAVEGDRAHIAGLQLVGAHDFLLRLHQRLEAVGNLHHVDVRRVEHALGMLLQAEDRRAFRGLVGAQAFEDPEAVMQRMGEDVDGRGSPGN